MAIETESISRFIDTDPIKFNGIETFGKWQAPSFLDRSVLGEDDIIKLQIENRLEGRPDLIALEQYGNSLLEWVVVMFNKPKNPLNWPLTGEIIELPATVIVVRNI